MTSRRHLKSAPKRESNTKAEEARKREKAWGNISEKRKIDGEESLSEKGL